jgi:hypothetical protein
MDYKIEYLNKQIAKWAAHADDGEEIASIKRIEVYIDVRSDV